MIPSKSKGDNEEIKEKSVAEHLREEFFSWWKMFSLRSVLGHILFMTITYM